MTDRDGSVNPLRQLLHYGQSVWLDELQRSWLHDGTLEALIRDDGLRGVTSNPTIFQKALGAGNAYDDQIAALASQGLEAPAIYDELTLTDIRTACDILRSVYDHTGGADGYVSHEVTPELAYDTWGTIREARRLWQAIGRPNAMIKIPATPEGIPAVRTCLSEGININVTLMFGLDQYEQVVEAFLDGMADRVAAGASLRSVASVASFFVSRVDTHVDELLSQRGHGLATGAEGKVARLAELRGQTAVANAARAYKMSLQRFSSTRFAALEIHGARRQRLLWASTSTKSASDSPIKYVQQLVAAHTVNTMPLSTLNLFRELGSPATALTGTTIDADAVTNELGRLGIDLLQVGRELLKSGVVSFAESYGAALEAVESRRMSVGHKR